MANLTIRAVGSTQVVRRMKAPALAVSMAQCLLYARLLQSPLCVVGRHESCRLGFALCGSCWGQARLDAWHRQALGARKGHAIPRTS